MYFVYAAVHASPSMENALILPKTGQIQMDFTTSSKDNEIDDIFQNTHIEFLILFLI